MNYHTSKNHFSKILGLTGRIIKWGCITHCFFKFVISVVVCEGHSMEPTINSNDILITEKITPRLNIIQKGNIIIARSPRNPNEFICKRVAGVPGDKIRHGFMSYQHEIIPDGHVWLEGDNKGNSTDSCEYGAVPQGLIRDRAILKVWPPHDFGILKNNS